MSASVETNTNQVYRKKYFVEAERVVFSTQSSIEDSREAPLSRVVDAASVVLSKEPVMVHGGAKDQIRVEALREGRRLKGLKINCPCGRHLAMDVEYEK